jgi:hypothetical protein
LPSMESDTAEGDSEAYGACIFSRDIVANTVGCETRQGREGNRSRKGHLSAEEVGAVQSSFSLCRAAKRCGVAGEAENECEKGQRQHSRTTFHVRVGRGDKDAYGVGARSDSARAQRRLRGVSGVGHGARYGGVASSVLKGGSRALFDSRASSCLRVQQRERTKSPLHGDKEGVRLGG